MRREEREEWRTEEEGTRQRLTATDEQAPPAPALPGHLDGKLHQALLAGAPTLRDLMPDGLRWS